MVVQEIWEFDVVLFLAFIFDVLKFLEPLNCY